MHHETPSDSPGGQQPGADGAGARPAAKAAAWTLVFYGLLVLAAAVVGVRREAGLPTAPSWSILHLVVVMSLAIGLLRGWPWAWWGGVALAAAALLLLLPVVLALVGGSGITLLVPRLDLVLVTLQAAALVLLLALLVRLRRSRG